MLHKFSRLRVGGDSGLGEITANYYTVLSNMTNNIVHKYRNAGYILYRMVTLLDKSN